MVDKCVRIIIWKCKSCQHSYIKWVSYENWFLAFIVKYYFQLHWYLTGILFWSHARIFQASSGICNWTWRMGQELIDRNSYLFVFYCFLKHQSMFLLKRDLFVVTESITVTLTSECSPEHVIPSLESTWLFVTTMTSHPILCTPSHAYMQFCSSWT